MSRRDQHADVDDEALMELLMPGLDDRPGPARRMPQQRGMAMIDQALDVVFDATPAVTPAARVQALRVPGLTASTWAASGLAGIGPGGTAPAMAPGDRAAMAAGALASKGSGRGWRRSPLQLALAAALLLVAVGGASAGIYFTVARSPVPHAPAPAERSRRHGPVPPAPPLVEPVREPDVEPELVPAMEPVEAEAEPMEFPTDAIGRSRRSSDSGPADATPEDLLRLANERRRAKRWSDADAVYRRVIKDHGSSSSAYVAMVASASLHLDHLDDAAGARKLFRQALSRQPSGALVEEARFGLAEAERALGDESAERAALSLFVAAHPDSPLAERARARLRQVGGNVGGNVGGQAGGNVGDGHDGAPGQRRRGK
jgi:hypothetical protein